ncbi:hypothetical protein PI125_g1597 [Phytophthora idaei]|nr:hypothetical protein PI125_g1597 [Phytophthora idaei]
MKLAEEQGLTLVTDKNGFLTCTLHTLAVALVTQEEPFASLLIQLSTFVATAAVLIDPGISLQVLLAGEQESFRVDFVTPDATSSPPVAAPPSPVVTATASCSPSVHSIRSFCGSHVNEMPPRLKTGNKSRGEVSTSIGCSSE